MEEDVEEKKEEEKPGSKVKLPRFLLGVRGLGSRELQWPCIDVPIEVRTSTWRVEKATIGLFSRTISERM